MQINIPSTQATDGYLTVDSATMIFTLSPTDVAQLDYSGTQTNFEVYLPAYGGTGAVTFQIMSIVLPYCEIISMAMPPDSIFSYDYEINVTPKTFVEIEFTIVWSNDSTEDECENGRDDSVHFQFINPALLLDERPASGFFEYDSVEGKNYIFSVNMVDKGSYTLNISCETLLPSETTVHSTETAVIAIEMAYNVCFTSTIVDQPDFNYDWEYLVAPEIGSNYTSAVLPYF